MSFFKIPGEDEEDAPTEKPFGFSSTQEESKASDSPAKEQPLKLSPFKIDFQKLNADFKIPPSMRLVKKLGAGAYGKVMEAEHIATGK